MNRLRVRRGGVWRAAALAVAAVLSAWGATAARGVIAAAGEAAAIGAMAEPAGRGAPPAGAPSAPTAVGFHLRAEGSFEERRNGHGGWDRTVVEPRYAVVKVQLPPRHNVELVLAERLVSTSHTDAEASESRLEVTALASGKGRFDVTAWSFADAADDGAPQEERELFVATKHGCCGGEDVRDWYSLRTGRQAATSTGEGVAFVAIPNTTTARVVAYHSTNGQRPPQMRSAIPQLLGVLTLGSHDGPLHRVAVTAAGVDAWTPALRLQAAGQKEETVSLDLWAADKNPSPRGIGGFRVKLTYEDRPPLVIPVQADDFDLAHATVPAPFHLQRIDEPRQP